jgi:hypothetical protein
VSACKFLGSPSEVPDNSIVQTIISWGLKGILFLQLVNKQIAMGLDLRHGRATAAFARKDMLLCPTGVIAIANPTMLTVC